MERREKKKKHQRFLGLGDGAGSNYQEAPRFGEGGRQGAIKGRKVTGRKSWRSQGSQVFVCKCAARQPQEELKEKTEAEYRATANMTKDAHTDFSCSALGHPVTFVEGSWRIVSLPWKGNSAWAGMCQGPFGLSRLWRGTSKAHISAPPAGDAAGDRGHLRGPEFKVSRAPGGQQVGRAGGSRPRATPPRTGGARRGLAGRPGRIRARLRAAPRRSPPARAARGPRRLSREPPDTSAPQAARRGCAPPSLPRPPRPAEPRAHSPSPRSASSSGLGARRPMLAGRERLSPASCVPAASPPPPPPAPAAPESALPRLGRAPAPLSSRAEKSQRWAVRAPLAPRRPPAYPRPPPASRLPPAGHREPGAGAAPPSRARSPGRFPKAKGKSRSARPPAPPIRRSASNKHKLSQAPPRSR